MWRGAVAFVTVVFTSMVKGRGPEPLQAAEKRLAHDIDLALKSRVERASAPPPSDGPSSDASEALESVLGARSRALAPHSTGIRTALVEAQKCLAKRGSFDRELYYAAVRGLSDAGDKRLASLLKPALANDDAGGLATLSAACFTSDASLGTPLARAAASSKTQVSFAAEIARLCRGEPTGAHLSALAPKVKEAHRISLCLEVLLPISMSDLGAVCAPMADALHVLRAAERHLGRWLVMAEIAHKSGDPRPLQEALDRSSVGPQSSRAAWSFVAWALDPASTTPSARPTCETVARLSHRPSAEKDMGFLFRLGEASVPVAAPMLEALARQRPLLDGTAVRASHVLARRYGQDERKAAVAEAAAEAGDVRLRGVATAALWDLGDADGALGSASGLVDSGCLEAQIWGALVGASANGRPKPSAPVLRELTYRRVHAGWME